MTKKVKTVKSTHNGWCYILTLYRTVNQPSCVNKRKNSGNKWMLENNITRCPGGSSQLETGCADWGLWALSDSRLSNPSQDTEEELLWSREEPGSVRPCLHSFLTHNKHHLFENKVWEIYIFIKKCIRSLLQSSLSVDYVPMYICIRIVYNTTVGRGRYNLI